MAYLILKSCVAGGAARNAGEIVNLSETEAKSLISMRRVELINDVVPQEPITDRRAAPKSKRSAGNAL